MSEFVLVLLYAAIPSIGNLSGGIAAEYIRITPCRLSLALHATAGIVLAVVAIELLPTAMQIIPAWLVAVCFLIGGVMFLLLDRLTHLVRVLIGGEEQLSTPITIFLGVAVDLFTDGIMIGVGSTVTTGLAFLIALAQVPADIPEGLAKIAAFKNQNVPSRIRNIFNAALFVQVFIGATIGYWLMRGQPEWLKMSVLVITAGILTTLIIEEISPEAHRDGEARFAALVFVGGFALFILLASFLK